MDVKVTQSCLTLFDPVDCSPPGSSVHGILQARMLEWGAISFSRGSSPPRDRTQVSCTAGRFFCLSHRGSPKCLRLREIKRFSWRGGPAGPGMGGTLKENRGGGQRSRKWWGMKKHKLALSPGAPGPGPFVSTQSLSVPCFQHPLSTAAPHPARDHGVSLHLHLLSISN